MTKERKVKILCVEDEQEIRENIAEILRDEGFEVFEAENGKVGFEVFMQNKPDLVVSDIMMPELDGYGLLKLIRENNNVKNNLVPFIFLTALGQKDNLIKGVKLSANDYLVKPIDFDLMIAKVKEKTANSIKVEKKHEGNIKNIKSQVSSILPNELLSYLDVITKVSTILKDEPYGPYPHRRYLEDIEKIHFNSMKLRSAIVNSLDEEVIDYKLNADEEIVKIYGFTRKFIQGLSSKFRNRIILEEGLDEQTTPDIKTERVVIVDAYRKILAGMLKSDHEATVKMSVMIDHMDQMVIIFYLNTKNKIDLKLNINESEVGDILDNQNCSFEIVEHKDNTAVLTIPSFRLIAK